MYIHVNMYFQRGDRPQFFFFSSNVQFAPYCVVMYRATYLLLVIYF